MTARGAGGAGGDKHASIPFEDVVNKYVAICDAFDANGPADAASIIRDRKLHHAGEAVVRGRRCHRIRSWNLLDLGRTLHGSLMEWSIDAETFFPARVELLLVGGLALFLRDRLHLFSHQPTDSG